MPDFVSNQLQLYLQVLLLRHHTLNIWNRFFLEFILAASDITYKVYKFSEYAVNFNKKTGALWIASAKFSYLKLDFYIKDIINKNQFILCKK